MALLLVGIVDGELLLEVFNFRVEVLDIGLDPVRLRNEIILFYLNFALLYYPLFVDFIYLFVNLLENIKLLNLALFEHDPLYLFNLVGHSLQLLVEDKHLSFLCAELLMQGLDHELQLTTRLGLEIE